MSNYDPKTQWKVADKRVVLGVLKACQHMKADAVETLAAFETIIVESDAKDPVNGDLDSVGPFQQRAGWGSKADRMDPYKSAVAFLDAARPLRKKYASAGDLAYAVQRCAYAYRKRYGQAKAAAQYMIAQAKELQFKQAQQAAVAESKAAAPAPVKTPTVQEIHAASAVSGVAHPRRDAARAIMRQRAANHSTGWYRQCQKSVRTALNCPGGSNTAYDCWLASPQKHHGIPEAGTAYYFESASGSSGAGHAVLVETPGKDVRSTTVWSTDILVRDQIRLTTIGHIIDTWGEKPLGWLTEINGQAF